jgi:glycosidase
VGSPFAIESYTVREEFGGDEALRKLCQRLHQRGMKLMLDFVPNHVGPDHEWLKTHPEFFIFGTEQNLAREPQNWGRMEVAGKSRVVAYGRDPYFGGWTDTVQLNYRHSGTRAAMLAELLRIAERCDGVRCDMAMLLEPDVIAKTWGDRALPRDDTPAADTSFWPSVILEVRKHNPEFVFMAEVYWGMDRRLQQEGFDFTYDKALYDLLKERKSRDIREHLSRNDDYQNRSARFLENHDEQRAAAVFGFEQHRAAALIAYLTPGVRFFHEGQFDGRKAHTSMHLARRVKESSELQVYSFYRTLLKLLQRVEVHDGEFKLASIREAWAGNPSWNNFVCFSWRGRDGFLLIVVNYGATQGQCFVTVDWPKSRNKKMTLHDLADDAIYERNYDELQQRGLYIDLPAWGYHLFDFKNH